MNESYQPNRRVILSWCLYDFANSPFTTLIVTFIFAPFFMKGVVGDNVEGTRLWSWAITVTALSVAILSPILGAAADRGGYRKLFLIIATTIAALGSCLLYWTTPRELNEAGEILRAGSVRWALIWFVIANIAYELGCVFYNAFLPDIAPANRLGRISGYGWAAGYLGGLLALFTALGCLVFPETPWFGFSKVGQENIRATNLLVGVWFAIFSVPIFLWIKERKSRCRMESGSSFRRLYDTFHEIRRYRQVVRLLLARLFYNDGLITIFAFSGIYATGTFNFSTTRNIDSSDRVKCRGRCGRSCNGISRRSHRWKKNHPN